VDAEDSPGAARERARRKLEAARELARRKLEEDRRERFATPVDPSTDRWTGMSAEQVERGAGWADHVPTQVHPRPGTEDDRKHGSPEEWGRFFASLANVSVELRGITDSPVQMLKERGLRGDELRVAIEQENELRRAALPPTDPWIARWRSLRGQIDDGLPDAAILPMIERHRVWLRRQAKVLCGRTGMELDEALTRREHRAAVSTAIPLSDFMQPSRPGAKLSLKTGYWALFVTKYEQIRVPGSAADPETNLLFLALSLPTRVLFRLCAREGCGSLLFVENEPAQCCSVACRKARWLTDPGTRTTVREQTLIRVQRSRALKRARQIAQRMETEG